MRGGISLRDALLPPIVLCISMLLIASWLSYLSGVDGTKVFSLYVSIGMITAFASIVIWSLAEVGAMASTSERSPLGAMRRKIPMRLEMVVLPGLILPIFLAGFSTTKTAIPFVVGYTWETFWADADRAIFFGADAWRVTHAVLGAWPTTALAFVYSVVWMLTLFFSKWIVAIYGGRRLAAVFFTALMLDWIVGGCLMAYAVSAAGPIYAEMGDPNLAFQFAPLHSKLNAALPSEGWILGTQAYLAEIVGNRIAESGGGISAMPSMHVANVTIVVLATRGTRWLWPAMLLWVLILIGSVHFGYHYALDGVAGTLIALLCWKVAESYFDYIARARAYAAEPAAFSSSTAPALGNVLSR